MIYNIRQTAPMNMTSYFTKAEKANASALRFGMRALKKKAVDEIESTLFGEADTYDDWSFNKPFFPKFLEGKTHETLMEDLAKIYEELALVCDRGMVELPAQYTQSRKRKSALHKYQDFVDNFNTIGNDMQELRSMCDALADYVYRVIEKKA